VTWTGEPEVRVLLVDPTGTLVSSIRPCLERAGCEVVVTGDVDPALGLVDAFMPDVVLVQHGLPSGTGFDVLSAVRSDPRCAGTGVVLVMEDGESAELLTPLDLGADDFLCAPFTPVELLARIQAVLRRRALVTPARVAEARLAAASVRRDPAGATLTDDTPVPAHPLPGPAPSPSTSPTPAGHGITLGAVLGGLGACSSHQADTDPAHDVAP